MTTGARVCNGPDSCGCGGRGAHRRRGGGGRRLLRRAARPLAPIGLVIATLVAFASPASAEPQLSVEAGFGGQLLLGHPYPVRVTVDADRLVRGTLTVRTNVDSSFGGVSSAVPIEVAAGAKKTFVVVMASTFFTDTNQNGVVVTLDSGSLHVKREVTTTFQPDVEMVGVLPDIDARTSPPSSTALTVDAGTARLFALDDQVLGTPGAIDPLDVIVTDERSWLALAPPERTRIVRWMSSGGRLLVDAPDGTVLDGLPAAWKPGATRRAMADAGDVVVTGATGRPWWESLEPTPTRSWSEDAQLSEGVFGGIPVSSAVARDAGVRLARIGWLTGFLVLYLVVVGPGVYLVLRRTRRTGYLWAVVPATAAVFTVGAWVAGRSLHRSSRSAHATVLVLDSSGAQATTWIGRSSNHGGTFSLGLPDGWGVGGQSEFSGQSSSAALHIADSAGGRFVSQSIPAGGFSVTKTFGPQDDGAGLVVRGSSVSDGHVKGTVRNTGQVALDEVAVFAGLGSATVGRLEAGADASFEIVDGDGSANVNGLNGRSVEAQAWPNAAGFGAPPAADDIVSISAVQEVAQASGANFRPLGKVQAIGWTRDLHPPLLGGSLPGRTAVVASAVVTPDGGPSDMAIQRSVVRAPGIASNGNDQQAVFAFTLPADTAAGDFTMSAPIALTNLEIWTDGKWHSMHDALVGSPRPIPSSAGSSGTSGMSGSSGTSGSSSASGASSASTEAVGLPTAPAPPLSPGSVRVVTGGGGIVVAGAAGPIATIAAGPGGVAIDGSAIQLGSVTVPSSAFVDDRLYVRVSAAGMPGFVLDSVHLSGMKS